MQDSLNSSIILSQQPNSTYNIFIAYHPISLGSVLINLVTTKNSNPDMLKSFFYITVVSCLTKPIYF